MLIIEYWYIFRAICLARKIQDFLWGERESISLEHWQKELDKRLQKINNIELSNPHWKVEFTKRSLQNAALSICVLASVLRDRKRVL